MLLYEGHETRDLGFVVLSGRGVGTRSKSKVIVVPPEIAWHIVMELPIMRRTLILLAAATGMRISELLGLQWGDIDWEGQRIHLNRTWVYGEIGEGKSEESRQPVAMGKRMTNLLQQWQRDTLYAEAADWDFPSLKLRGTHWQLCLSRRKTSIRKRLRGFCVTHHPTSQWTFIVTPKRKQSGRP